MKQRFVSRLLVASMVAVIGTYAIADDTHKGKLVEIGKGKLTMTDADGKNRHTHNLAADLKINLNGKTARMDDLKKDVMIEVTVSEKDGKQVVTKIVADTDRSPVRKSGYQDPDKPGAPVTRASKLIGASVKNSAGEDLGKIEDIVMEPTGGRVRYAVLSFGGFLGVGDKWFAVPWRYMTIEFDKEKKDKFHFVYNVDKEKLKNAPGFDKNNWPDFGDSKWTLEIDTFFGGRD
jgi:sporulation protein YlmC with PRC-barrel domain/nitrogen regulatory protein PII